MRGTVWSGYNNNNNNNNNNNDNNNNNNNNNNNRKTENSLFTENSLVRHSQDSKEAVGQLKEKK